MSEFKVAEKLGAWHIGCGEYSVYAKRIVDGSGETVAFSVTRAKRGALRKATSDAEAVAAALNSSASLADAQAEIARLRGALESASNYVDNLGGVSKTFRSYLNK